MPGGKGVVWEGGALEYNQDAGVAPPQLRGYGGAPRNRGGRLLLKSRGEGQPAPSLPPGRPPPPPRQSLTLGDAAEAQDVLGPDGVEGAQLRLGARHGGPRRRPPGSGSVPGAPPPAQPPQRPSAAPGRSHPRLRAAHRRRAGLGPAPADKMAAAAAASCPGNYGSRGAWPSVGVRAHATRRGTSPARPPRLERHLPRLRS